MDAIEKFLALKADTDDLLAAISSASADHFDASPDTLDWGDVGALARFRDQLAHAVADYVPLAARAR